jgi:deazaflavin-dependent oxidoreductase (nitroreductase family)
MIEYTLTNPRWYPSPMALEGEYEPSPFAWVREQVELYESSSGREGGTLFDTGFPVIILTTRGAKSAKLRKTPVMRVAHGGEYALVASMGGKPSNPLWYHNLVADPVALTIQDGPEPFEAEARQVEGGEREDWWTRAIETYPPYAQYQLKTDRLIPVFVARPKVGGSSGNVSGRT